ncbi:MAG: YmdB family metallophosphoesterase, partial [Rhodospirillales bacterium]|nr:YmdB family metallophosphoesterase [Rhodospirillales bacterium]
TIYNKLIEAGVDGITLGDHAFKKQQIVGTLEQQANIIRPANISAKAAGRAWMKLHVERPTGGPGVDLFVFTLLGRVNVPMKSDDPFAAADRLLAELPAVNPLVLVEVHAEATGEKVALGWYLNRRVVGVVGTHTHVATADARILPGDVEGGEVGPGGTFPAMGAATGYISDVGMCGPHDSVLGRRVDRILKHMTTGMHAAFDVAEGNVQLNGVVIEIDEGGRGCTAIERFTSIPEPSRNS